MEEIFILAGPTGVGKTELSIKIAKNLNGEIISVDSMQIYKYMNIGSAKINQNEMDGVNHHLIDIIDPREEYSVSLFKSMAEEAIHEISLKNKLPILVGGTGLYINSLLDGYDFTSAYKDEAYRNFLENEAIIKGKHYIHSLLEEVDRETSKTIHPNNLKRVIRALEVYHITGKPMSNFKNDENSKRYNYNYFVLTMDREKLYNQINQRVDKMLQLGLLEEVKMLRNLGLTKDDQSMKGIGYKELLDFLDGKITLDDAVELIKQRSRNYAKRQLTWFRHESRAVFINKDDFDSIDNLLEFILSKKKDFPIF